MNASPRENLRKKFMERRKKAVSCKAQKDDELRPAMGPGTAFPGADESLDHLKEGHRPKQLHRFLVS